MEFNQINNIKTCFDIVNYSYPLPIIYYSHIISVVSSLVIGLFVFFKDSASLMNRLLFSLSITFALWILFSFITWTSYNGEIIQFVWSFFGVLTALLFVFSFYLTYVFINKKDIGFFNKALLGISVLPLIFLTPTKLNLSGFSNTDCESIEGSLFTNYYYLLGFFISLWLLAIIIIGYRRAEKDFKKQVMLFGFGIEFFLIAFFVTGFVSSLVEDYTMEFYGLFSMAVFMGFLAYLIVKYKAFNVRLLGAQALVVSLVLLIGSQFAFIQNNTNRILTGITLALALGFGYVLIRSVKKDAERKEELQFMADKLANANDSLRKLDNAKTEFISIASHQLRTPITAIKGFSSLLLEGSYGELSENVKGAMEKVYSSADRLVALIEDLLNVSRIESGRMQFSFEKSSVEKLIKELYDNFILIAKTKKFYLDLKMPEAPLPEVVMDYTKIRELTSNFIDNALKYTEKGGVTIKAELREAGVLVDDHGFVIEGQKSDFGPVVRITVSDTGIGIPKEEIPYLFKKFSRGKDVSRLHVGGTGLGLYVGKAIAEAHHGQVWVESDGAGLGSRFIIEIPVEHVA